MPGCVDEFKAWYRYKTRRSYAVGSFSVQQAATVKFLFCYVPDGPFWITNLFQSALMVMDGHVEVLETALSLKFAEF